MMKCLVGLLAILLIIQEPAEAQALAPESDTTCRWVVCVTRGELLVGGLVVAGAAAGTALTASAYAPGQAAELAAGVLLSSAFSLAASFAALGVAAYYYGPQLWRQFGNLVDRPPEQAH